MAKKGAIVRQNIVFDGAHSPGKLTPEVLQMIIAGAEFRINSLNKLIRTSSKLHPQRVRWQDANMSLFGIMEDKMD